jgi:hypothetical protein
MRYTAVLLMSAFIPLTASPAAAGDPSASEVRLVTRYARVSGRARARETVDRVGAAIDDAVPRIAPLVGTDDLRPVSARVYLDRREFREATGIAPRSLVVGLASLPDGQVHVDGTGVLASIERVVPHEVGHVLIGRAVGQALPALPRWLNEGIAEYVAGERAAQVDPVALRAIGRGRALDLSDLDGAIARGGADAGLAYAQAASVVNFLVDRQGETVIAALLQSIRQTADFETSVQQVTGLTTAELEASWRRSVSHRWRWILLFQSSAPVFGLMLLLFLVGFIRHYREKRRRQEAPDDGW